MVQKVAHREVRHSNALSTEIRSFPFVDFCFVSCGSTSERTVS